MSLSTIATGRVHIQLNQHSMYNTHMAKNPTLYSWYNLYYRHPDKSSRPSFTEVVEALSEPEIDLLCWSEEDTAVHPQAAVLGAPLEAGVNLYPELQGTYT